MTYKFLNTFLIFSAPFSVDAQTVYDTEIRARSRFYLDGKVCWILVTIALLTTVTTGQFASAQCSMQIQKMHEYDPGFTGFNFGSSVAVDGDAAIVGAAGDGHVGSGTVSGAGAAYILRRVSGTWIQEARLTATDAAPFDGFGKAVAISGNVVVVGASGSDVQGSDSGAAYVFRKVGTTWVQEAKLIAPDNITSSNYSFSVSIDGNVALIGAPRGTGTTVNSGSAYIFVFTPNGSNPCTSCWGPSQKLIATDGTLFDNFGASVAVSGHIALIGSSNHLSSQNLHTGVAYVFKDTNQCTGGSAAGAPCWASLDCPGGGTCVKGPWVQESVLTPPDGADYDAFGSSLDFDGAKAIVGARQIDGKKGSVTQEDSGAAYVFRRAQTGFTLDQKLVQGDVFPWDYFGGSVRISGNDIAVGSDGYYYRRAYLFNFDGNRFSEVAKLTAPAVPGTETHFGFAVDVSAGVFVVGDYGDYDLGLNCGSASFFASITTCPADAYACSAGVCHNDGSCTQEMMGNGTVCTDMFTPDGLCTDGACFNRVAPPNSPPCTTNAGCNDGQFCTADRCISGFCQHANYPNGTACDDGNPLTSNTTCGNGVCGSSGFAPTITATSAPNGYVDPLEDRDATTGTLYGLKDISITFSAPVTSAGGSGLGASNFQVRCVRNGAAASDLQTGLVPSVTQVSGSGAGPYNLQLSQRLCLGGWTEIKAVNVVSSTGGTPLSATGYDNRVVLGNLPMDITQDGRVLGDDISRWLSINNNAFDPAPLTKLLLLDQKRNGVVAGEDITRGIQLINGTGTFRAWTNFDMGVKP